MDMLDKILVAMDERGLDQDELERRAKLPKGRISKWKKGTGRIAAKQALAIARVLKVSLESLIDESSEVNLLSENESDAAYLIQLFKDLGLTREEAARRLAGQRLVAAGASQVPSGGVIEGEAGRRRTGGKNP